jgi:NAD(P)-dependent dehydrogenase (short-subunit alcohol dehydrogenase family)
VDCTSSTIMLDIERLFSVRDKIVLVTGGSRGIGEMIAGAFVAAGASVYITARNAAECEATAHRLRGRGDCRALPADVGDPQSVRLLVEEIRTREPRLDVLVNNAGIAWGAPLADYPLDAWDRVFAVNVRAMFQLTRDLLPQLKAGATAHDPSRVINLGSVAGMRVVQSTYAYAYGVSKAAVNHLTATLAMELAASHVTVNAVSPGVFPSRMTEMRVGDRTMLEVAGATNPLRRPGSVEDIAGTCLYLASRAGAYLTGAVIPLDGGLHARPIALWEEGEPAAEPASRT